jgi:hypothetical protein
MAALKRGRVALGFAQGDSALSRSDAGGCPWTASSRSLRTSAATARRAEEVDLTTGAEPERLRWEHRRPGPRAFGGDAARSAQGCGRRSARPSRRSRARFAQQLDDDFIDRFAICGAAWTVRDRLRESESLGIDRVIVVPGSLDAPLAAMRRCNELLAREVLPALTD